jgi:hypothetical protein
VSVLILEGLTGTGKSSTIAALRSIVDFRCFDEHATFGDFASEFRADRGKAARGARGRMSRILDEIEADATKGRFLLERFHFSQLALGSEALWYATLNERCVGLCARVAVLALTGSKLAARSLYRSEYGGSDWQNLIGLHGSETAALAALGDAQSRRLEAIAKSGLEYRVIDTADGAWPHYAALIAGWMGWR